MKVHNVIHRATNFGTFRSRENFISFALKCIFYIIPVVILGNFIDKSIQKMEKNNILGNYILYYILLQTLLIILTLYLILIFLADYTHEF